MPEPMYASVRSRDEMAQGRMLLILVIAAFFVAWVIDFFTSPVYLVPGVIYDSSGATLGRLFGLLIQYGIFSTFAVLVGAGFGWVRYVFASYLLVAGMFNVFLSMAMDTEGGAPLVMGTIYLASATALALSTRMAKYLEHRRKAGIPWLAWSLGLLAFFVAPLAVSAIDLGLAVTSWQSALEQNRQENQILRKFAPDLDAGTVLDFASDDLKQEFNHPGARETFQALKAKLGGFVSIEPEKPPTLKSISLHPRHGHEWASGADAHYEHGSAFITVTEQISAGHVTLTSIQVRENPKNSSATE